MIRIVNFLFIAVTGLMCLGLYRVAEATRVAEADLGQTMREIGQEHGALTVLQAEWARVTQPARVAALAARHLDLSDAPILELSSLSQLPRRDDAPLVPDGGFRNAKATVPGAATAAPLVATGGTVALHTGA